MIYLQDMLLSHSFWFTIHYFRNLVI